LWQARSDTVHAPPHDDWVCLARAGRDAMTPMVCGTYNACGKYKKLDIVVSECGVGRGTNCAFIRLMRSADNGSA
jgi:hypothetical protein